MRNFLHISFLTINTFHFRRLVCSLLHWSAENPVLTLQVEIDALAQDHEGFTPLMRACFYGKTDTATFLYRWNPSVIKIRNYDGETCLDLAAPHDALFAELEVMEKERMKRNVAAKKTEFAKPKSTSKKYRAASLDESQHNLRSSSSTQQKQTHAQPAQFQQPLSASRKLRSTSPAPLTHGFRSASPPSSSPSVHQPLSINVDLIQPTTTGVLHPRGSVLPSPVMLPAKRLSKRSSFDSGINLAATQQQIGKKDSKTVPK